MVDIAQLSDHRRKLDGQYDMSEEQFDILKKITPKQREVLRLTFVGKTSKEIALELGIVPRSVDQRLDAARITLGASTRAEAARKFYDLHRASEGLTSDPFMLGEVGSDQRGQPGERPLYVFGDALQFHGPSVWKASISAEHGTWRRFVPGLPSVVSGSGGRRSYVSIRTMSYLGATRSAL